MFFQKGDVIIEAIETMPKNLKEVPRKDRKIVLAEGEATGHAHTIKAFNANLFTNADPMSPFTTGDLFLTTDGKITITHEEHKAIDLPKGNWKIRKVQEYDHFAEEARAVRD